LRNYKCIRWQTPKTDHKTKQNLKKQLYFIFVLLIAISCSKKFQKGTIYMGQGGGIAANWREFQLNADGKLFLRQPNATEVKYLRTLDSSATRKIFKRYYKLKLDSNDLDAPGNIYYYVGHKIGKFRNNKVVFGHPEAPISKEIQQYFDDFMTTAQDSTKLIIK
jgi:hypothetical protein